MHDRWQLGEPVVLSRATNRVVRPFEWGLEPDRETGLAPAAAIASATTQRPHPRAEPVGHGRQRGVSSGYQKPADFRLDAPPRFPAPPLPSTCRTLRTTSSHAQWFPATLKRKAENVSPPLSSRTGMPAPDSTVHCAAAWRNSEYRLCASACPTTTTACGRT